MANVADGNGNYQPTSLAGKVALVTGAGRGIGRAIALELARRGANVALNFRADAKHAESAADEIRELGVECLLVQGDVAKKGEAARIVKEVLDKWQRLDILVNNAGITRDRSMRKMTDEDWAAVINVNLNGTFYCTSAAVPAMINQRFGRIINISSVVGQMGAFGQANYSASKGGIIAFTKTLALEMADSTSPPMPSRPASPLRKWWMPFRKRLPRRSRPRFLWDVSRRQRKSPRPPPSLPRTGTTSPGRN